MEFLFEEAGTVEVSACATFSNCQTESICGTTVLTLTDLSSVRPGEPDERYVANGCAYTTARTPTGGAWFLAAAIVAGATRRRPAAPAGASRRRPPRP